MASLLTPCMVGVPLVLPHPLPFLSANTKFLYCDLNDNDNIACFVS